MSVIASPVDGTPIAYSVVGPHDAPPALLVHGTALSAAIWRGFGYLRALRGRYRLVLPDLRGHGRSGKPTDPGAYALETLADDLAAILDAEGVDRAHYLGYSFGGRIGLRFTLRHADRVRSLAVGGATSHAPRGSFDDLFFPGAVDVLDRDGTTAFLDRWNRHREWPLDASTRAAFAANDSAALAACMRRSDVEAGIPDAELAAITAPTVAFVGSRDVTRVGPAHTIAHAVPHARVATIRGFDHSTAIAALPEVLSIVEPLWTSVDGASRADSSGHHE